MLPEYAVGIPPLQAREDVNRILVVCAFARCLSAEAAEPVTFATSNLPLSAGLQSLYRQEMVELLAATQRVATALPVANWKEIESTAVAMRQSYVLEKKLTRQQQDELTRLPREFQTLDEAFHARAEKLEHAARAHDAESVAFQFSRLLEECTACHTQFAETRFPGFAAPNNKVHTHPGAG